MTASDNSSFVSPGIQRARRGRVLAKNIQVMCVLAHDLTIGNQPWDETEQLGDEQHDAMDDEILHQPLRAKC
jgi:hypothetical protein